MTVLTRPSVDSHEQRVTLTAAGRHYLAERGSDVAKRTQRVIVLLTPEELSELDALSEARYLGFRSKALVACMRVGLDVLTSASAKPGQSPEDALTSYVSDKRRK